ncbi:MAG: radical SAM protein, partial [Peptococcaceae bacterium]|nr:radical SAM protein [Peptococcaceae bacterium]
MGELFLEPPVYRPPSEAFSLILQLSLGCSHNACTFCGSYKGKKFRKKEWPEIERDIIRAKEVFPGATRVFLADGNAMALDTELLKKVLNRLYRDFPGLERVGIYAGTKDILAKTPAELAELHSAGLS